VIFIGVNGNPPPLIQNDAYYIIDTYLCK